MGILLLAYRRLKGNRLLGNLHDFAHAFHADFHGFGDLLRHRLTAQLLQQLARYADQFVDRLDHMHRDADRTRLIRDGARNGLADPPRRISAELIPLVVIELFHGLDEPQIAFLDEVKEKHASSNIAFRYTHDETQVCLSQCLLRRFVAVFHALGQIDFLIGRQKGYAADFLEIHAHRIIYADALGDAQVNIRLFLRLFLLVLRLAAIRVVNHLDALAVESFIQIVNLVRRELLLL